MHGKAAEWYEITNIGEIDSPALVIYPDRVRRNVQQALAMTTGPGRLRPHAKTHKSPEATRLQIEEGIEKFKCATIAEAEMLAQSGARDVLLAYQPVGPKIERLLQLVIAYPRTELSCLVDHPLAAEALSRVMASADQSLPVFIDLDVGMHRTGVTPDARAIELWSTCASFPGIEPRGLHAYDGHIRGGEERSRRKQCDDAFAPVAKLASDLSERGGAQSVVVAGGSPTFPYHTLRDGVECSPGTFVYWDKGYEVACPEQPFQIAALVITRVISVRSERLYCLDLGHKSIAAENPIGSRVSFLNMPEARLVSQSEEHCLIETERAGHLRPGDVLYGAPYHICPTCALYERGVTVYDGRARGEWSMGARDRRILA